MLYESIAKHKTFPTLILSVFSSASSLFIQPISHSNCRKSSNKLWTRPSGSHLSFPTNTQSRLWRPHSPCKIFVLPDQNCHAWSWEVWWRMLIQEPAFQVWTCYGKTFTAIVSSGGSDLGWNQQLEKRARSPGSISKRIMIIWSSDSSWLSKRRNDNTRWSWWNIGVDWSWPPSKKVI